MLTYINKKRSEKGFTLVELMVVLLIIAILIAVAIPVFLGARNRAYDNSVKQALMNSGRAAASYYASNQDWPTLALMQTEETAYTFADAAVQATAANPEGTIGYVDGGGAVWTGISRSGTTFTLTGTATGGLTRGANW